MAKHRLYAVAFTHKTTVSTSFFWPFSREPNKVWRSGGGREGTFQKGQKVVEKYPSAPADFFHASLLTANERFTPYQAYSFEPDVVCRLVGVLDPRLGQGPRATTKALHCVFAPHAHFVIFIRVGKITNRRKDKGKGCGAEWDYWGLVEYSQTSRSWSSSRADRSSRSSGVWARRRIQGE